MCSGGGSAGDEIERQNKFRLQNIQTGQKQIDRAFTGFDPSFYSGVRQNTLNTLLPQLSDQYKQNRRSLVYGLGSRGLLNSSVARLGATDLERNKALGEITVGNQANEAARQTQQQVEQQKQSLTNQLVVSQDPALAGQQAVSAAASISAPSMVAPLGNLFQTFGNTWLARQTAQQYPQGVSFGFGQNTGTQGKNYYVK